jgi:hypothetical protein
MKRRRYKHPREEVVQALNASDSLVNFYLTSGVNYYNRTIPPKGILNPMPGVLFSLLQELTTESISLIGVSLQCRALATTKIKECKMNKSTAFLICVLFLAFASKPVHATDSICVMIVATPAAIIGLGGPEQALNKLLADLENINQSFRNSRIDAFGKIVCTNILDYDEGQLCMYDMLSDVLTVRGAELERLHQMRSDYIADIVIMIVDEPSQCGLSGDYADPTQAFMLVHYECLGASYSMARQLGYLLGCGNNESQSGRFNRHSLSAYAYFYENHEDIPGESFSTIMGCTDERISSTEDDFDMIPYWLNSDTVNVRYHDKKVGDEDHDNARQIWNAIPIVAAYRVVYGMQRLENTQLLPYNQLYAGTKRLLEIDDVRLDQYSSCFFRSKKIRLTRVVIKEGSKVRIVSGY